jgi:hypothetical protein
VLAIEPWHDGWVVGDEPAVVIEFDFERTTAERLGVPVAIATIRRVIQQRKRSTRECSCQRNYFVIRDRGASQARSVMRHLI